MGTLWHPNEDLASEEAAAERYTRAFVSPTLFHAISALKGQKLAGWQVMSIYAVGAHGLLLRTCKGKQPGLLKMPHLPYDRPADFGVAEIGAARAALEFEARMLNTFANGLLPRVLEFARASNPLLRDRARKVVRGEKVLVMEFIPGQAMDSGIQALLRVRGAEEVVCCLRAWALQILGFLSLLKARSPGYFYTDFKPSNVRLASDGRVRLLDGGSITWPGANRPVPVTSGYCPRSLLELSPEGAVLETISLTTLGRALYASLLNRVLHPDAELDFAPLPQVCGRAWAEWLQPTCRGDWRSLEEAARQVP